jgi:hypothetical protein
MCVDCNPLESNTGLIHYSGPDLIICNGNTITNGELLTSVIAKFDNCIGILQNQLDMSSLVENSPCINLTKTSLLTVLQSILDTESAYCTQLQTLNTQLTALQNQVNNSPTNKTINVTACNGVTVNETPTSKTFQLGAFVPKKTILPYFGDISDFFPTGLGKPSAGLNGWAIADGRNGTINACGRYLKYNCEACCTTGGSNTVTLGTNNIPTLSFNVTAEFDLNFTGETDIDGEHTHKLRTDRAAADSCNPAIPNSCDNSNTPCRDAVDTSGADTQVDTSVYMGSSGCHSHTFTVDSTATGTFTGTIPNSSLTPINIEPSYIAGIPIQFLGVCS